jgi:hypothetical protein
MQAWPRTNARKVPFTNVPFERKREWGMKLFTCQNCGQLVYFENVRCERCSFPLGYLARTATLSALEPEGKTWRALAAPSTVWRFCANSEHGACNWLVPNDMPAAHCAACRHNRTIPQLSVPGNEVAWRKLEHAKHRLFYSLLQLRLPLPTPPSTSAESSPPGCP